MLIKAVWKGSISFGLVSIPISVYPATESKAISFRELHKKCGTPLEHKRWCPTCKEEVPWEDVAKGFEIGKDQYVMLTKEDIEIAKIKTTKSIEILKFVKKEEVDPIYFSKPYYLAPKEGGEKAYFLLKEALAELNKIAIAKMVMKEKEYYVAIFSYKKGLLMYTLHYPYEIRDISKVKELEGRKPRISKEERELAIELVNKLSGKFDASEFKDEFLKNLKKIIKDKLKGKEIRTPEEKAEKAKELLEALKESVKKSKKKK